MSVMALLGLGVHILTVAASCRVFISSAKASAHIKHQANLWSLNVTISCGVRGLFSIPKLTMVSWDSITSLVQVDWVVMQAFCSLLRCVAVLLAPCLSSNALFM